jgi:phenazine biosynthesis protein phzE
VVRKILEGDAFGVDVIHSIPLPQSDESCVLAIIPFRQIAERGYACRDDGLKIQVLVGETRSLVDRRELTRAGDEPFRLSAVRLEPDDTEYESLVTDVIRREIGGGSGSNFVIHRCLRAQVDTSRKNWLDEGARKTFSYLLSPRSQCILEVLDLPS